MSIAIAKIALNANEKKKSNNAWHRLHELAKRKNREILQERFNTIELEFTNDANSGWLSDSRWDNWITADDSPEYKIRFPINEMPIILEPRSVHFVT